LPTGSWAVLADSGPLFAATDAKDRHHARARHDLQRLADERRVIVVPYPILWECHSLLIRRLGIGRARSWLTDIQDTVVLLAPGAEDCEAATHRPSRYPDQTITLFDAVLAVMGDRLNFPIWTFDHHFDVMRAAVWR
jgi:predicted nucleic acid-binding protein